MDITGTGWLVGWLQCQWDKVERFPITPEKGEGSGWLLPVDFSSSFLYRLTCADRNFDSKLPVLCVLCTSVEGTLKLWRLVRLGYVSASSCGTTAQYVFFESQEAVKAILNLKFWRTLKSLHCRFVSKAAGKVTENFLGMPVISLIRRSWCTHDCSGTPLCFYVYFLLRIVPWQRRRSCS